MNKNTQRLLLAAPLALALNACVIAVGDWDDEYRGNNWESRQASNKDYIDNLRIGDRRNDIVDALGSPDFSESFPADGRNYTVLYYRTQHRHSDGDTTKDETTPLVFSNGELMGWGDSAVQKLLGRD